LKMLDGIVRAQIIDGRFHFDGGTPGPVKLLSDASRGSGLSKKLKPLSRLNHYLSTIDHCATHLRL
jgi:hypothetical protein